MHAKLRPNAWHGLIKFEPDIVILQVIGVLFEVESIREDQPRNILQVSLPGNQA